MKLNLKITIALLSCISSTTSYAENFKSMSMRELPKAISEGDKVVVIFHTDKSPATVNSIVSAAMKVADKDALVAKAWVTGITFRGYDKEKKCGMVIGQWWTTPAGKLSGNWENLVFNKVKNSVNTISFQYARNNTLQVAEDTPASNGDDIMELCGLDS